MFNTLWHELRCYGKTALPFQSADANNLVICSRHITKDPRLNSKSSFNCHTILGRYNSSQTSLRQHPHINKRPSLPNLSNNSQPEQEYGDCGRPAESIENRWTRGEHGILPPQTVLACYPPGIRTPGQATTLDCPPSHTHNILPLFR